MTQTIRIASNPEGLVSAPIGSFFYRRGERYFLISGITQTEEQLFTVNKTTFFRRYYNPDFYKKCSVEYVEMIETWAKVDNSRGEKYGWQFVAYRPPTFVGEQVIAPTPTPMASVTPTPTLSSTPEPTYTPTMTPEATSTPTPTSSPIALEDPEFFAVGYSNGSTVNFMKSSDGINWNSSLVANQGQLNNVEYGNSVSGSVLIAVEGGQTTQYSNIPEEYRTADLHVSTNFGETWTVIPHTDFFLTSSHYWSDIIYAGGSFILLSEQGAVITSSVDGMSWHNTAELLGNSLHDIAYNGNSTLVQISSGYYSGSDAESYYHAKTSTDLGATWTPTAASVFLSGSNFDSSWSGIAYGGGMFIAVGTNGTNCIMRSVDGLVWETDSGTSATYGWDIAYGHAGFVVVMSNKSSSVSADGGDTWISASLPPTGDWRKITYGNGVYVIVNRSATDYATMYSTDGLTWITGSNSLAEKGVQWSDVKRATVVKSGKYFLDVSSYSTLGHVPYWTTSQTNYYSPSNDYTLDGTVYIWKVEGTIETGSLICTNIRTLIGEVDVNSATSSLIDITNILARDTYGPYTALIFTTVGDRNSFTADLMATSDIMDSVGPISNRFVRRIPYLAAGNSYYGIPRMISVSNNNYEDGAANFAAGVEILDFETAGAIIQLSNGYPEDNIQYFEYSQDPLVRYTLDLSNFSTFGSIPSGSFGLTYDPNHDMALYRSTVSIWKISGSMEGTSSLISGNVRKIVGEININSYGYSTSSIDITNLVMGAGMYDPNTALIFTTTGEGDSDSWDVMTSASAENVTGSVGTMSVRSIPYLTTDNNSDPYIVRIWTTDDPRTQVGDVGFAVGVVFPDLFHSFAKIVLHNGYPMPPTYVEMSQNPYVPEPTPTPTPEAVPENDNFANATELFGTSGSVQGTNIASTYEVGDPDGHQNTVWWKWTPPISGTATGSATTVGSTFDTYLYAYHLSGSDVSRANLISLGSNDDANGSTTSAMTFSVTAGETYYLMVTGFYDAVGSITINYSIA